MAAFMLVLDVSGFFVVVTIQTYFFRNPWWQGESEERSALPPTHDAHVLRVWDPLVVGSKKFVQQSNRK